MTIKLDSQVPKSGYDKYVAVQHTAKCNTITAVTLIMHFQCQTDHRNNPKIIIIYLATELNSSYNLRYSGFHLQD